MSMDLATKSNAPSFVASIASFTVPLAQLFNLDLQFLVNVPLEFMGSFQSPDWGMVGTGVFWKFVFTYTLVASLESLLTAAAMDQMDPWKRPLQHEQGTAQ